MQFFNKKYRQIRRLGGGTFGQVYLVQNHQKEHFAVKMIAKAYIGDNLSLRQYVDGEIQCLKLLESPHIIKIYDFEQDKDYIYLLLQYCDQGDLYSYMLKNNINKFGLEEAAQLLADVIKGLEVMHSAGFLHRDLKPQNILIKIQNNKKVVKLGDFGVSKRVGLTNGSYLGTKNFQSPQVLKRQKYGFQIDMWAFGVVFFYMLNGKLLFSNNRFIKEQSFNKLLSIQQQKQSLLNQAQGFSYKKMAQNSMFNDAIQDLFKKIFELDPEKRITFTELRYHPIFSKHFAIVQKISSRLYDKQKFASKIKIPQQINQVAVQNENTKRKVSQYKIFKDPEFSTQNEILLSKKDEINFLNFCADAFYEAKQFLTNSHRFMLCYNIKKYALILLRDYRLSLQKEILAQRYQTQVWNKLSSTKEFKLHKQRVKSQWNRAQVQIVSLHDYCLLFMDEINSVNKKFLKPFGFYVQQTQLNEEFKEGYRQSASIVYSLIRTIQKQRKLLSNEAKHLLFLQTLLVICHSFNQLQNKENYDILFPSYFQQTKKDIEQFKFMEFVYWLRKAQVQTLRRIILAIVKMYFSK